jgi:hypothetical protein
MSPPDLQTSEVVLRRPPRPAQHRLSLLQHIFVEWGTKEDWTTLQELHYKGHTLAAGSRFMRCILREPGAAEQLIGIMVFANPRPLDGGRNEVFPHLKPNVNGRDNRFINQARLLWVNTNMTWNNRTVLDTMYRSAGIAYRFKNIAYRMYAGHYNLRHIESRSSMGRFNPFSIKTGMRFVKPKPAAALEPGLKFFAAHFRSNPQDIVAIADELARKPDLERAYFERKLREFYYKWSSVEKSGDKRDLGMTRVNDLPMDYVLKQIMQLVFSATVYWIWVSPDLVDDTEDLSGTVTCTVFNEDTQLPEVVEMPKAEYRQRIARVGGKFDGRRVRRLPSCMPLLAFEDQGPNEPLTGAWVADGLYTGPDSVRRLAGEGA